MVMGETEAAVVVACLLQRSSTIQSAGGYLRELTRKAGEGEFSLDLSSWLKLTPGTVSGDPPEGRGWLTVLRDAVPDFRSTPNAEGEFRFDLHRSR
jgi:hypothetical protein